MINGDNLTMEIWLYLCFDGEPVDNIICNSEDEVQDVLKNHSRKFHDQNEEIVDWWLSEGFRDNPDVTIRRADEYHI